MLGLCPVAAYRLMVSLQNDSGADIKAMEGWDLVPFTHTVLLQDQYFFMSFSDAIRDWEKNKEKKSMWKENGIFD